MATLVGRRPTADVRPYQTRDADVAPFRATRARGILLVRGKPSDDYRASQRADEQSRRPASI